MRKILIVEDDRFISAVYSLFLKNLGYEIVGSCKNGSEAFVECNNKRPDIVLMDIHLEGDLDGIQTAEKIKRDCEVPVIFVSGDTSSDIVERAAISNSYGYLVKPVNEKELGITIELAYYKHKADLDQKNREQNFRAFISEAPMPIMIVQDGSIRYLNHFSLDLFKTHYMEDLVGLPLLDFVDEKFHDRLSEVFESNDDVEVAPLPVRLKTLHQKAVEVMVHFSRTRFNDRLAFQLAFVEMSEPLAWKDAMDKWRRAVLGGVGAVLLLNSKLEVIDYNRGLEELIHPVTDMRTQSLSVLAPALEIDASVLTASLLDKEKSSFDLTIKTPGKELPCEGHLLLNAKGVVEEILIAVK